MSPACLFSYYVEARKGKVHKTQAPVLHARGPALKSAHIWVSGENTIRETCCGLPLSRSCSHDPGAVPSCAPPLLRDGRHSCASVGAEHAPSCATTPYRVTAGLHDHSCVLCWCVCVSLKLHGPHVFRDGFLVGPAHLAGSWQDVQAESKRKQRQPTGKVLLLVCAEFRVRKKPKHPVKSPSPILSWVQTPSSPPAADSWQRVRAHGFCLGPTSSSSASSLRQTPGREPGRTDCVWGPLTHLFLLCFCLHQGFTISRVTIHHPCCRFSLPSIRPWKHVSKTTLRLLPVPDQTNSEPFHRHPEPFAGDMQTVLNPWG